MCQQSVCCHESEWLMFLSWFFIHHKSLSIIKVICADYRKIRDTYKNIKKKNSEFIAPTPRKKPERAFWFISFQTLILTQTKTKLNDTHVHFASVIQLGPFASLLWWAMVPSPPGHTKNLSVGQGTLAQGHACVACDGLSVAWGSTASAQPSAFSYSGRPCQLLDTSHLTVAASSSAWTKSNVTVKGKHSGQRCLEPSVVTRRLWTSDTEFLQKDISPARFRLSFKNDT